MYLVSRWTNTERLILNLDYFIPLFLLFFRSKLLFIISFVVISFFDFLILFSQIFPFIHLSDLIYLLKFSFLSSSMYKLYGVIVILLLCLQIFLIIKIFEKKEDIKAILIIFNICILFYAFHVNFSERQDGKFWKPEKNQIIASQLINYWDYRNKGFLQTYNMQGDAFQNSKIKGATQELFNNPYVSDKVLVVINESWGVPINDMIQQDVLAPLLNSYNISDVKQGILEFEGFTIGGELRELCQKAVSHFNLKNQKKGFENCLPHVYQKAGYKTISVHGALGLMYDRQYWYPRAGFGKMLFRDQGLNLPDSYCYSFPGNCDWDIEKKVEQQFKENKKVFLYWLTLNTHATYDKRDLNIDIFNCEKYKIQNDNESCRNLKLQTQYFYTLSKLMKSPYLKGTKVIVVGDHQPPIMSGENNFKKNKIPYFEFKVV
ncbi:integrase [Acinetobacter junii]|nr:integrase [Acinetobacter junii]